MENITQKCKENILFMINLKNFICILLKEIEKMKKKIIYM